MSADMQIELPDGLRRIVAPNPSPMTLTGTNTYLVGSGDVAVIDPGPAIALHLDAILAALHANETITHIFITHSHKDHSPLARELALRTGAPIHAFGPSAAGRSALMESLAAKGTLGGGEGVDDAFVPDVILRDGQIVKGDSWELRALHTPGHMANHLCFQWQDFLFSGDHVMDWASTMVSPPDGDLGAFMTSCERLLQVEARTYFPGHGVTVESPRDRVEWLLAHRRTREAQIVQTLATGPQTLFELTNTIYNDVDPALIGAASRNVLAHLIDLFERGHVKARPELGIDATFQILK